MGGVDWVGGDLLSENGEDRDFADDVAEACVNGLSGDGNGLECDGVVWEVREPRHGGESGERSSAHEVSDEAEVDG